MKDKSQPENFLQHKEPESLHCYRCGKYIVSCDCVSPMTKQEAELKIYQSQSFLGEGI